MCGNILKDKMNTLNDEQYKLIKNKQQNNQKDIFKNLDLSNFENYKLLMREVDVLNE